jgi:hypothetical protein
MLELYLVLGGLMNTCQYGFIYAIIHVMQEHFITVNRSMENHPGKQYNHKTWLSLIEINPLPTPIYGCNMAVLVASGISCIEVRWSVNGCNWNGAIA